MYVACLCVRLFDFFFLFRYVFCVCVCPSFVYVYNIVVEPERGIFDDEGMLFELLSFYCLNFVYFFLCFC